MMGEGITRKQFVGNKNRTESHIFGQILTLIYDAWTHGQEKVWFMWYQLMHRT
jgi:hypothetical protein